MIRIIKKRNKYYTNLNIRGGFFNYESKKKFPSTKAININNLSEYIKIKILCEFDNNIKDKDHSLLSSSNENKINDSGNKYVPKVNLMKQNHSIKSKINVNNINIGRINGGKKKFLGNSNMNSSKKNFNNSSQEFSLAGEYSTYLTEEINNIRQTNNEIKKLNELYNEKLNSFHNELSLKNNKINEYKNKISILKNKINELSNELIFIKGGEIGRAHV